MNKMMLWTFLLGALLNGPSTVAPAGRTLGTSSRLLYDVLGAVYDRLGFDEVGDTGMPPVDGSTLFYLTCTS